MTTDFNLLTSKQKKVYSVIESFIKTRGIPPTVREIGELVGEKTPGAVQGILNRLEQKGVIKREVGMARSIQLVNGSTQYMAPVYLPKIKKITNRNIDDLLNVYNVIKYYPLPSAFFESEQKTEETCFIINCPDNSLLNIGIKYEDSLIIDRAYENNLNDGDIVLVLYESHVLLRYFSRHEDAKCIVLKADSDLIGKEVFNKDEVIIIGKLIGKYTKF
ncbi:MAG: LexA repressor [Firmicutes bacterium ADurb.Bin419]|nr:MAG: LexA repressor [Firmicutes bacterium ADurb.Bin419]